MVRSVSIQTGPEVAFSARPSARYCAITSRSSSSRVCNTVSLLTSMPDILPCGSLAYYYDVFNLFDVIILSYIIGVRREYAFPIGVWPSCCRFHCLNFAEKWSRIEAGTILLTGANTVSDREPP